MTTPIKVEFEAPMVGSNYDEKKHLCTFTYGDGSYSCDHGETLEDAFNETMFLLKIKIMHDNGIEF